MHKCFSTLDLKDITIDPSTMTEYFQPVKPPLKESVLLLINATPKLPKAISFLNEMLNNNISSLITQMVLGKIELSNLTPTLS